MFACLLAAISYPIAMFQSNRLFVCLHAAAFVDDQSVIYPTIKPVDLVSI